MNKAYKLSIIEGHYFKGTVCGCGQPKRRKHWCCKPCKVMHWDSICAHLLRDACNAHVKCGAAFIRLCKRTK